MEELQRPWIAPPVGAMRARLDAALASLDLVRFALNPKGSLNNYHLTSGTFLRSSCMDLSRRLRGEEQIVAILSPFRAA